MNYTYPKGSALVIAMVLVILMASLTTVLVKEMSGRAKSVEVDLEDLKAFEAAEAGIDAALNDINSSPVYQPRMDKDAATDPTARRTSPGVLLVSGAMPQTSGIPLKAPKSLKPITVHVARKADGTKPGCLGTSTWVKPYVNPSGQVVAAGNDIVADGRPTWKALPLSDASGADIVYSDGPMSGQPRYCEDNIVPQSLGHVAFFTYAIDWFHDGIDNDGDGLIDDRNERNKYTIYSTGIHRGLAQSGVSQSGMVVSLEVMAQALDKDVDIGEPEPWNIQYQ